jgi:hypothetical protein
MRDFFDFEQSLIMRDCQREFSLETIENPAFIPRPFPSPNMMSSL